MNVNIYFINVQLYFVLCIDTHLYFVIYRNKRQWESSSWTRSPNREASCPGFAYTYHASGVT